MHYKVNKLQLRELNKSGMANATAHDPVFLNYLTITFSQITFGESFNRYTLIFSPITAWT